MIAENDKPLAVGHRDAKLVVLWSGDDAPTGRPLFEALEATGYSELRVAGSADTAMADIGSEPPHMFLLGPKATLQFGPQILAHVNRLPHIRRPRIMMTMAGDDPSAMFKFGAPDLGIGDWLAADASTADAAQRIRLNAELAVLRRHVLSNGSTVSEAIRRRIAKLEEGLRLLRTAHRRLEQELAEARQNRIDAAMPPARVVHEMRTPLNAISGFAEIMHSELHGPLGHDKYRTYVEAIFEASKHLLDVVNDLLDIYRLEAGELTVAPESTDIRNALHSVTRMLTAEANKAGVALTTDIDAWLPAIETDARRLRQVLINLVGNAIKFTPSGGRILVKAASVAEQECLKLSVNDTGVGIAQTDLDEVVKPFGGSKAQARKSIEGSGLGLSIAKLMVERLGGKFGIDSTQGAGTEVTLTLPLKWQGPGFGRESTPPPN